MEQRTIAFIGAGNMAHAIIAGLVASGYDAKKIIATAPSETRRKPLEEKYGIRTTSDNLAAANEADVVVLAVKPQLMADVCAPLQAVDYSNKLVISIAAGISVARFNEMLATELQLVRVMPNTPSLVNKGMAGLYAAQSVSQKDKDFTSELMSAVGEVCWVEQESGINSVIAAQVVRQLISSSSCKRCKKKQWLKGLMNKPLVCLSNKRLWAQRKWYKPTLMYHWQLYANK